MIKKLLTAVLAAVMVLSVATGTATPVFSLESISGETSRTQEEILLSDGTSTGVVWTRAQTGAYNNAVEVNIAEADLSDTHISIETLNCGANTVAMQTVPAVAASYTGTHSGQTVLAAINGDLWMTQNHSNSDITTSVLQANRGVMIIDREVWSTEQIGMENAEALNEENGTTSPPKSAFGVTSQNQPLVGSPVIGVSIKNNTKGGTFQADGINRLPAMDSLIVYNHRINSDNYALNDAYEVYITAENTAFTFAGTVTGTVTGVYSGNDIRPAIETDTVVLTARGNKASSLNGFTVGNSVSIELSVTDRYGNSALWENVVDAIGGHMTVLSNGKPVTNFEGNTTAYPSTFIGYKDDGTVMLCTVTSPNIGSRAALRFDEAYKFCSDAGYNSVFYLDGGGSTTMATLSEGSYTVRNKCSDGEPRSVTNAFAVVWNNTPVCAAQGSLSYIKTPLDISGITPVYLDGEVLHEVAVNLMDSSIKYNETTRALDITLDKDTNDPYIIFDYCGMVRLNADDYPYLVLKIKSGYSQLPFKIYYMTGDDTVESEANTDAFTPVAGGEWQYVKLNLGVKSGWSGNINKIRFDIFESASPIPVGTTMSIGSVALFASTAEADAYIADDDVKEQTSDYFLAASLNLESDIGINYYVFDKTGMTNPTLEITGTGNEALTVITSYTSQKLFLGRVSRFVEGAKYYTKEGNIFTQATLYNATEEYYADTLKFTYAGNVKNSVDSLSARLKFGAEEESELLLFGVADYCRRILTDERSSRELKAVCANLLNYATEAQRYFEYKTNNLAENGYEQEINGTLGSAQDNLLEPDIILGSVYNGNTANDAGAFDINRIRLGVDLYERVCVYVKFSPVAAGDYSFVMDVGGAVIKTAGSAAASGSTLEFTYSGLDATQMSTPFIFWLEKSDGTRVTKKTTYSIESYAEAVVANTTTQLSSLVQSMIMYGTSAEAYFKTIN